MGAVSPCTLSPTSRQLHEAERIADRYGRAEWTMREDRCMVVLARGDNPEPNDRPITITLDPDGYPVAAEGRPRKREKVEM